ncbi:hypothetical protein A11A3_13740 [Alcanivorax hongdengensis A-11-3]|uniref:VOC domain-containing protein n=1 Tax=Alcanivorax hongdengensis A-11-3 TaxID=1177179 RepID=L0W8Y3_9GAMM|nr:VOC family protein [Alcanivorax hongdengensis]EKF73419.1 hypothetical protein A11A3_13740 [Alcanivorax hongdengensis A-11-3]
MSSITPAIIPTMMYRDAHAAIRWLCEVIGFSEKAVYLDESGDVAHAELVLGNGMIMLGGIKDNEYGQQIRQPDEVGAETQSPYVVVANPAVVYQRVKEQGGEVIIALRSQDYGGQHFTFRDPQGHLWNIGSYDPWA